MKIVHLTYPVKENILSSKIVLALGFFDGVHLGHQRLVRRAKEIAEQKNLPLVVMTFDRHPKEIYEDKKNFKYLETLEEKADKMTELGVDYLAVMPFTKKFSSIGAQDFVDNVIVKLNADTVVAGFDYTYGPKEIANMEHLPDFAKGRFDIVMMPKQIFEGKKIGSTEIRQAIKDGKMELAYELMGHHYVMSGTIGHGKRNGHKLGFPTANLIWAEHKVIPKIGVYATKTEIDGKWYESMTSVGYNVTIGQPDKIYIESNLFDFNQDVYGKPMKIKWYKYTRGEVKFDSLDELKDQLMKDKTEIKAYFDQEVAN
ncbi:riboflavin biosynthesis protein RibF [Lactobacillus ultunensis]|uniref:Riboflavin biosynthesis protein n=1 Tax=Lactobacillus ultunensis DSM 16047 TaxID=525365 RepID=C2EKC2_9LACO|nr:riboflavin biosynthesis protein RibF [Lactobacillus ultunensis]EEJ73001.1 riboflavin biosynthesis protein RibF [Lactobacillus ultunensis DSM 16047]KRL81665.1 FAD synthetase [Lactobacillus ultunensis DSM 16047]QQP29347.1 riboflavin biosynthesis protein RibF [Lactobacillus ultunensis]